MRCGLASTSILRSRWDAMGIWEARTMTIRWPGQAGVKDAKNWATRHTRTTTCALLLRAGSAKRESFGKVKSIHAWNQSPQVCLKVFAVLPPRQPVPEESIGTRGRPRSVGRLQTNELPHVCVAINPDCWTTGTSVLYGDMHATIMDWGYWLDESPERPQRWSPNKWVRRIFFASDQLSKIHLDRQSDQ